MLKASGWVTFIAIAYRWMFEPGIALASCSGIEQETGMLSGAVEISVGLARDRRRGVKGRRVPPGLEHLLPAERAGEYLHQRAVDVRRQAVRARRPVPILAYDRRACALRTAYQTRFTISLCSIHWPERTVGRQGVFSAFQNNIALIGGSQPLVLVRYANRPYHSPSG